MKLIKLILFGYLFLFTKNLSITTFNFMEKNGENTEMPLGFHIREWGGHNLPPPPLLVVIGLTEFPDSGLGKAHLAHLLAASLNHMVSLRSFK